MIWLLLLFQACIFMPGRSAEDCDYMTPCVDGDLHPLGLQKFLFDQDSPCKTVCEKAVRKYFAQKRDSPENPWIAYRLGDTHDTFEISITKSGSTRLGLLFNVNYKCLLLYSSPEMMEPKTAFTPIPKPMRNKIDTLAYRTAEIAVDMIAEPARVNFSTSTTKNIDAISSLENDSEMKALEGVRDDRFEETQDSGDFCDFEETLESNRWNFSTNFNAKIYLSQNAPTLFSIKDLKSSSALLIQCTNDAISKSANDPIWKTTIDSRKLRAHLGLHSLPLPTAPILYLQRLSYHGEHKLELEFHWTCPRWYSKPLSYEISCVTISGEPLNNTIVEPMYAVCKRYCRLCLERCWSKAEQFSECNECAYLCNQCWSMWHTNTIGLKSGGPIAHHKIIGWTEQNTVMTFRSNFKPFEALFAEIEPKVGLLYHSTVVCKMRATSVQGYGPWSNVVSTLVNWKAELFSMPKLVLEQDIRSTLSNSSISDIVDDILNGNIWHLISYDNISKTFYNYSKVLEATHAGFDHSKGLERCVLEEQLSYAKENNLFTVQDPVKYSEIQCFGFDRSSQHCDVFKSESFSMKPSVTKGSRKMDFAVETSAAENNSCFDFISSKWYTTSRDQHHDTLFITEVERNSNENTSVQPPTIVWKDISRTMGTLNCIPSQSALLWTTQQKGNFYSLNGIAKRGDEFIALFQNQLCHRCTRKLRYPLLTLVSPMTDIVAVITDLGVELLSIQHCDCKVILDADYIHHTIGPKKILQLAMAPTHLTILTSDKKVKLITLPLMTDLLEWANNVKQEDANSVHLTKAELVSYDEALKRQMGRRIFKRRVKSNQYSTIDLEQDSITNVWSFHTAWNLFSQKTQICLYPIITDVELEMRNEKIASFQIHAEWDRSASGDSCSNISKPSIIYKISHSMLESNNPSLVAKLSDPNFTSFKGDLFWQWQFSSTDRSFCKYSRSQLTNPHMSKECTVRESPATRQLTQTMHMDFLANRTYYIEVQAVPLLPIEVKDSVWFDDFIGSQPPYIIFSPRKPYVKVLKSTLVPQNHPEKILKNTSTLVAVLIPLLIVIFLLLGILWHFCNMQIQIGWNLKRIHKNDLKRIELVGQGNFCEVWKCKMMNKNCLGHTMVAVKVLKSNGTEKQKKQFLEEAFILSKLQNCKYIIKPLGISIQSMHPTQLVLEYCSDGSVSKFLRKTTVRDALTNQDLLRMCIHICKACCYLEAKGYIHRDIAARNCLVVTTVKNIPKVVKLADFGLAKDETNFYETDAPDLAVPWTAPECFQGRSSSKSDVWSFGIYIWEVFSWGSLPYGKCGYNSAEEHSCPVPLMSHQQIRQHVCLDRKTLLDYPNPCTAMTPFPPCLTSMFRKCWNFDPRKRCTFPQVLKMLQSCGGSLDRKKGFPGTSLSPVKPAVATQEQNSDPRFVPEYAQNLFVPNITQMTINTGLSL